MNTKIFQKVQESEAVYDIFDKLAEERIIFVHNFIDDKAAADISAALLFLDTNNKHEKISLYINCDGGDIRSVFMIYDIMNLISAPVETLCLGTASFEAVLLLSGGKKGMRFATKNATICSSQLVHSSVAYSDLTNAEIIHNKYLDDNKKFLQALSKNIGKTYAALSKDLERQIFMTSTQAKTYGIIDGIIK